MELDWQGLLRYLHGLISKEVVLVAKADEGDTSMAAIGAFDSAQVEDAENGETMAISLTTGAAIYVPQDQFKFAYIRGLQLHIGSGAMVFQITPR